jgi:hypothetical protein
VNASAARSEAYRFLTQTGHGARQLFCATKCYGVGVVPAFTPRDARERLRSPSFDTGLVSAQRRQSGSPVEHAANTQSCPRPRGEQVSSPLSCRKSNFPRETTSDSRSGSLIPVRVPAVTHFGMRFLTTTNAKFSWFQGRNCSTVFR